jgi:hypothetical protein
MKKILLLGNTLNQGTARGNNKLLLCQNQIGLFFFCEEQIRLFRGLKTITWFENCNSISSELRMSWHNAMLHCRCIFSIFYSINRCTMFQFEPVFLSPLSLTNVLVSIYATMKVNRFETQYAMNRILHKDRQMFCNQIAFHYWTTFQCMLINFFKPFLESYKESWDHYLHLAQTLSAIWDR